MVTQVCNPQAKLIEPDRTEQISLRVRRSVLQWFKHPDKG